MKEIRVGDIYIRKSTKQRLVYVGDYNTQSVTSQVYKEKNYELLDMLKMQYMCFVDISDFKAYSLNVLDMGFVKAKTQFTEKERELFLIKLQMLGKIEGYSDKAVSIDCIDVRKIKIGTTLSLAYVNGLISKYQDELLGFPVDALKRVKLCLTRMDNTLYRIDTIVQTPDMYLTIKSNEIDLKERYKGVKELLRLAIKNYGYLECRYFRNNNGKPYEPCIGTTEVQMSDKLQIVLDKCPYKSYLSELMQDVNTISFLLFICLKKLRKEEFYGYMAEIFDRTFPNELTLNITSNDKIIKEPLVIKSYMLEEYFDEMYKIIEQILGKTGPKYSIKKLAKEKNWCHIQLSKEEDLYVFNFKKFGIYLEKQYISKSYEKVMDNVLEQLDKDAYIRQHFILKHFQMFSDYMRIRT